MSAKDRLQTASPRAEQRQRTRDRTPRPRQFFGRAAIVAAATDGPAPGAPLMTLEQVRRYLNLSSVDGVYRLIEKHALPTRLVGGRYRVAPHELEAWTKGRG